MPLYIGCLIISYGPEVTNEAFFGNSGKREKDPSFRNAYPPQPTSPKAKSWVKIRIGSEGTNGPLRIIKSNESNSIPRSREGKYLFIPPVYQNNPAWVYMRCSQNKIILNCSCIDYNKGMRKAAFLILVLLLLGSLFAFSELRKKVSRDFSQQTSVGSPSIFPSPTDVPVQNGATRQSLFVPYWSLSKDIPNTYDRLLYFGITPTTSGIDTKELGYKRIETFLEKAPPSTTKLLVLRMLDNKDNFDIIENKNNRSKVISETLTTAKDNGFSGVVLDLEIAAIPFDSVTNNISDFIAEFADKAHANNLTFVVATYGDTFFRLRPFDMKKIGSKADEVMIMAYDLHKARGNPGPNFPLSGKDIYGYDLETMIADFSEKVNPKKLTVIFGMFGYDWLVDEKGKAVENGKSLAFIDSKKSFIDTCSFQKCEWKRDEQSGEITVIYIDEDSKKHIVWFEDPSSVARKEDFLKKRGISSFSLWAHSYF